MKKVFDCTPIKSKPCPSWLIIIYEENAISLLNLWLNLYINILEQNFNALKMYLFMYIYFLPIPENTVSYNSFWKGVYI